MMLLNFTNVFELCEHQKLNSVYLHCIRMEAERQKFPKDTSKPSIPFIYLNHHGLLCIAEHVLNSAKVGKLIFDMVVFLLGFVRSLRPHKVSPAVQWRCQRYVSTLYLTIAASKHKVVAGCLTTDLNSTSTPTQPVFSRNPAWAQN